MDYETQSVTVVILFTGEAIAISVVITFIIAAILGFLTGLKVMHLCSRKKAVYSPVTKGLANVGSLHLLVLSMRSHVTQRGD